MHDRVKSPPEMEDRSVTSRSRWIRATALLCGATMLGGCYTYTTVGVTEVPIGSNVRAQVTPAEADSAESVLGYHSTTLVGQVLERGTSALVLRVPGQVYSSADQTNRFYQQLSLKPSDVLELQTRKLDVLKTGGLIAAGVATLAIVALQAFGGQNGGALPAGGTTNRNAISIPLSFPIP